MKRSWKTFENIIGRKIDIFRITTLAVNGKFVRRSRIEASTSHSASYSIIYSVNQVFLALPFWRPMFDILRINNAEMNNKAPTVFYVYIDMWDMPFRRLLFIFSDNKFTKLALSTMWKLNNYQPKVPIRSFLIILTMSLGSLMTSQNAGFWQDYKAMHKPVSKTDSSIQSECVQSDKSLI